MRPERGPTTTVRRFRDGVDALPTSAAAGKLVTIALCLLIGVISLGGLVKNTAVALSHHGEVQGVVTACRDAGTRSGVCTVVYDHAGARTARVDASGVTPPRPGERVPLWLDDDRVYLAGASFVYDSLAAAVVLGASVFLLGAIVVVITRIGESNRRLYPD